jgi:hypothetical protein
MLKITTRVLIVDEDVLPIQFKLEPVWVIGLFPENAQRSEQEALIAMESFSRSCGSQWGACQPHESPDIKDAWVRDVRAHFPLRPPPYPSQRQARCAITTFGRWRSYTPSPLASPAWLLQVVRNARNPRRRHHRHPLISSSSLFPPAAQRTPPSTLNPLFP